MQIFRLHPKPPESDTVGMESTNLCFKKPSKGFWWMLRLESTGLLDSGKVDIETEDGDGWGKGVGSSHGIQFEGIFSWKKTGQA